ncbi:hypothetical protein ACFVUN_24155 [Kitasatospora griseola]|uniref:hypothetical protein n=1 Tax=Kitasatospora griseola TaxID=2064 RepID=UPI0036DBCEF4
MLVHRAREGLRPAYLRAYPGSPHHPSCAGHRATPAGHARGRAGQRVERHLPHCADGRRRPALLRRVNLGLAALLGPPAGVAGQRGGEPGCGAGHRGAGQPGAGVEAGFTGAATDPRAVPEVFPVNGRPCRVKVW